MYDTAPVNDKNAFLAYYNFGHKSNFRHSPFISFTGIKVINLCQKIIS